ncbi:DUF4260 domain-containing protein [Paenibacillus xylaniclasticus]|uniref:DUF4260 domain-containing protein n=1 Tax=Paenibacillus xylaniclasticus TaxID=588083 RepID=UPI000FD9A36E|nr:MULTISPECIES: DUF4260 domain-containing protein [Paenibacillus]GFN31390.1 hypothetical protein PCURB6_16500 [Paenibacillus curdlanolyticus]
MNRRILRLESLLVLAGAIVSYAELGYSWILFGILFFLPDAAMVGYLINKGVGARIYNLFHNYAAPMVLLAAGYFFTESLPVSMALIWIAHIAMDRAIGYGLKYATDFKDTHLQRI